LSSGHEVVWRPLSLSSGHEVIAGYLKLTKVATVDNVADLLTKIVTGGEFTKKADLLLGH